MAATRYYYSDSIDRFMTRSVNEIVGELTLASQHDINDETSQSWVEEIMTLREDLRLAIDEAIGLTLGNLYYFKRFYLLYNQLLEKVPQVGEIFTHSHHSVRRHIDSPREFQRHIAKH